MKTWKLLLAAMMALVMLFAVSALAEAENEAEANSFCLHLKTEWRTEKEATCENDGVSVLYCEWCRKPLKEATIPATGHQFGEWTVTTPAT